MLALAPRGRRLSSAAGAALRARVLAAAPAPGDALVDMGSPRPPARAARLPASEFAGLALADARAVARALRAPARARVVVGGASPLLAARLWWVLTYFGLDGARALDGPWPEAGAAEGAGAGEGEGEGAGAGANAGAAAAADLWDPAPVRALLATAADVLSAGARGVQVVDARSPAEYAGLDVRGGAPRGGHVPGARNVPWTALLAPPGSAARWAPARALRETFERAGVDVDAPAIVLCHAGVRAAAGVLGLAAAGAPALPQNYDASMAEWLFDPALPVVRGDRPF